MLRGVFMWSSNSGLFVTNLMYYGKVVKWMTGANQATIEGIVNENFVYYYLERLIRERKIAGIAPAFGVYKGGEIDFFIRGPRSHKDYAIEVKTEKTYVYDS